MLNDNLGVATPNTQTFEYFHVEVLVRTSRARTTDPIPGDRVVVSSNPTALHNILHFPISKGSRGRGDYE